MANYEGHNEGNAGDLWLQALSENEATEENEPMQEPEEESPTTSERDINADSLDALYEANAAGVKAREQEVRNDESLEALYEANELNDLEEAEKDVKESGWKRLGGTVTRVYRKLIGFATGRKIETSAESAEATMELAGKIGKKAYEVAEKLVKTSVATATQTVMNNMGLGN